MPQALVDRQVSTQAEIEKLRAEFAADLKVKGRQLLLHLNLRPHLHLLLHIHVYLHPHLAIVTAS